MERLNEAPASSSEEHIEPGDGTVVLHAPDPDSFAAEHEKATHAGIAERIAALKGFRFAGEYSPAKLYSRPVYFIPNDTLVHGAGTDALGISGERDLFGGIVPHPFVATKAITHSLVAPDAAAPSGWSHEFGIQVRDAVHRGFSVFTMNDARRAAAQLLERAPVRIKPVRATGGRGQAVISEARELDPILDRIDPGELSTFGLVLEENLTEVKTYSVGQVRVAELVCTYCGTQRLTPDNSGKAVYGGSDLLVARGGFDALLDLGLPQEMRLAVAQAQIYDRAAMDAFPSLIASRRNYDIAQGRDAGGEWRSGVLEQSWRIGGASSAEISALEAFRADPALKSVHATSMEVYAEVADLPPEAVVYFRGVDKRVGPITKYAMVVAP